MEPGTVAVVGGAALVGWLAGYLAFPLANRETRTALPPGQRRILAALTSIAFTLMAWKTGLSWSLPALLLFAALGVLLAAVDLRHKLLPNRLVLPLLLAAASLIAVAAAPEPDWLALIGAAVGSSSMFILYLLLALVSPRGIGMGDVKFSAVTGLYAGYFGAQAWLFALLGPFILHAAAALVLLALRAVGRHSTLPFGPFMVAAAVTGIMAA